MRRFSRTAMLLVYITVGVSPVSVSCHRDSPQRENPDSGREVACRFDVTWPLQDPVRQASGQSENTLLNGTLSLRLLETGQQTPRLVAKVELSRSDQEAARRYWNKSLEYEQIAWMSQVRVWDADRYFGERAPRRWPREPDFAGGPLAYFVVDWDPQSNAMPRIEASRPELTGFDWTAWIDRDSEVASAVAKPCLRVTIPGASSAQ